MRKTPMALVMGLVTLFSLIQPVGAGADNTISRIVARKATEHNIPVAFALGLVKVESNFNPKIRGAAGEYGLGQIKCQTAREVGFKGNCKELLDTETNLEYSFRYLNKALEKTDGNLCYAATLYNAGLYAKPRNSKYCRLVLAYVK